MTCLPEPRRKIYQVVFYIAAVYNLIWGVAVILFPKPPLALIGISTEQVGPVGLLMWQCIGMFVMVFAIGYYFAARNPERYAVFILIGTLGKIFGPVGFVYGWWIGVLPGSMGMTILTNDLIWWPVFIAFTVETCLLKRGGPLT
jgi:hypothetical protein